MKYRKKPVVVEVVRYDGNNASAIFAWSSGAVFESPVLESMPANPTGSYLQVFTLNGVMVAVVGDYIIRGVKGEFYPCKPDVFAATYEPVEED